MASKIYECIEKIGNRIIEEKEFLTELDREIGDADHGINMARGFTEVLGVLSKDSDNIGELLKKTGMTQALPPSSSSSSGTLNSNLKGGLYFSTRGSSSSNMFSAVRQVSSKTMVTIFSALHFSQWGSPSVLGSPVRAKFTNAPDMTRSSC